MNKYTSEKSTNTNSSPSFSVIIETENLNRAGSDFVFRCLDSLSGQVLPILGAKEVILINNGIIPSNIVERLKTNYAWLSIYWVSSEKGYYEAKTEGAKYATGEIIVFCDSDCIYDPNWLGNLLRPFLCNNEIQIVAGETSMNVTGPYSFGMTLIWGFPTFSDRRDPYPCSNYAANNVAFRRDFLKLYPIPPQIPIYRQNCAIHADEFRKNGFKIWKQDQARAIHPLPAIGFFDFLWCFIVNGHDWFIWHRLSGRVQRQSPVLLFGQDFMNFLRISMRWFARPFKKLPAALRENPRRLLFLPISLPIVLTATLLFLLGFVLTWFNAKFLFVYGVKKLEGNKSVSS